MTFYHEISWSTRAIVVASAKTYNTTGTYITLWQFRKDSKKFCFNQSITLSAAEADVVGQQTKTI